jgi:hypothetical protein
MQAYFWHNISHLFYQLASSSEKKVIEVYEPKRVWSELIWIAKEMVEDSERGLKIEQEARTLLPHS